jgi:hypothetical protein
VKTKLSNDYWPNSFDEIHDFFSKVIFESHWKKNALLFHFGFIKIWILCGFLDSLVEKASLVFGDILSNLFVPHVSSPLEMVPH